MLLAAATAELVAVEGTRVVVAVAEVVCPRLDVVVVAAPSFSVVVVVVAVDGVKLKLIAEGVAAWVVADPKLNPEVADVVVWGVADDLVVVGVRLNPVNPEVAVVVGVPPKEKGVVAATGFTVGVLWAVTKWVGIKLYFIDFRWSFLRLGLLSLIVNKKLKDLVFKSK